MLNRALLERQLAQLPLCAWEILDPKELEFSPRVRWICSHECPMYGKSWACPPAVGSLEECRERCLGYEKCLLIATVAEVEDIASLSQTLATRGPHEEVTDAVAELLQRQGIEPFVLSTEACALCSRCSWEEGKPCRHPQRMHPCIESHCINILPVIERLGMEFQYGSNVVTWFSLLFYTDGPMP